MTFTDALDELRTAATPADLFGTAEPARVYHRLAKLLHPDVAPAGQARAATVAFARLSTLWAEHQSPTGHPGPTVLTGGRHPYPVGDLFVAGDLANLYRAPHPTGPALLKIVRQPGDSDLLAREAEALTTIARHGDRRYAAYVPRLLDTFQHDDTATRARRTVTVLPLLDGFVPLTRVAERFPDGVDPRDVAWMWRRLLVALGQAHRAGVVHGAVLPEHVLIHPAEHGLVLVDWCYSVAPGGSVPALVARYRDRYPPEVTSRGAAGPGTDIYLASDCMRRLMGARAEPALTRFAEGCQLQRQRMRPQDAWRLLAELDDLLDRLYGPRTFRPFTLA